MVRVSFDRETGDQGRDTNAYERLVEKAVEQARAFIAGNPHRAVGPFRVIVRDEEQDLCLEALFSPEAKELKMPDCRLS